MMPLEGALDRVDDALDSIAIGRFFGVAVILCWSKCPQPLFVIL
jgi:hypothetical protein